jgi:predicted dehydrogenase
MLGLAIVGTGYWGKNLVRNFNGVKQARLELICDVSAETLERLKAFYPGVSIETGFRKVLANPAVQAVVISTPAPTHFELARQALEAGKHVFVEKPLCLETAHALELVRLSRQKERVLMVGHLLEYHPGVRWIKNHMEELGHIYYLYSQRLNLGIVRKDENAWWSLAPHDISVILYLLGAVPETVTARGACYLRPGVEDVVFASLKFADGKMAQVHVSWLDPHKIRKFTIVGDRKMITFDDMEASEKIKVFDKGAHRDDTDAHYGEHITLRSGDIYLPALDPVEPLRLECEHFVECCQTGRRPVTDGVDGLRVVQVLTAAQESLRRGGEPVRLELYEELASRD